MTISEALIERKTILKKINRIEEEIRSDLIHLSYEKSIDQYTVNLNRLDDYVNLFDELLDLNGKIDVANREIKPILGTIILIDKKLGFYLSLRTMVLDKDQRSMYSMEATKEKYCSFSIEDLNTWILDLENYRKELDKKIQKYNWTTEI